MSRAATAAINVQLTNYAQGHAPDVRDALAEFLCPTCRVPAAAGQYKAFNDANSFQAYDTALALGGQARRIFFEASDAYFNCAPQALEVTVNQSERELAGDQQSFLDESKVKALINCQAISADKKAIDYVLAQLTAVEGRGNWSNADIDPIDQLDEQLYNLSTAVGSAQNIRLALGLGAWWKLRQHPKVKARCQGVQVGGISLEQLQGLLMFPVRIKVGALAARAVKAPSATTTKTPLLGDNAILTVALDSPSPYDPSGFKTFSIGQGRVAAVRTWTDPSGRFDVHAMDWSEDIKKTSSLANVRLAIT